jgi:hypothetical protein
MINLVHIKVECFAGLKADKIPKYFYFSNNRLEIYEIRDRWYNHTGTQENPVADYFKVETTCGQEFILKHEKDNDVWYLCR